MIDAIIPRTREVADEMVFFVGSYFHYTQYKFSCSCVYCPSGTGRDQIDFLSQWFPTKRDHNLQTGGGSRAEYISYIPGEKPRLVLDFPHSVYLGKNVIPLSGSLLASAIRIGLHQTPIQKTRAVIDLSTKMVAHYATEYKAQEHTLIVTLTPDSAKPHAKCPPQSKSRESKSTLRAKKISRIDHWEQKFLLRLSPSRKLQKNLPLGKLFPLQIRLLLEISFDDSSGRGEMVLIRVNGFYPPTVRAIEKDPPRVLCDFLGMGS